MSDQAVFEVTTVKPPNKGHRFQPGHPRFGGRKPGAKNVRTATAREVAAKLKCDPLEWLILAAQTGVLKNADGTVTVLSAADRIMAMKNCLPFIYSKRSSVHVSGQTEHQHVHVDVTRIMMDPELADAAETLALGMIEKERAQPQGNSGFVLE